MWLLVGLGNPGPRYAGNRHNIDFMALDRIARQHGFAPWRGGQFDGETAGGQLGDASVLALKPMTYMNESGTAVEAAMRRHALAPERVVVLHDELDLPAGRLRTKIGGGHGGHNGLRSIDAHIGPGYRRVRLGIGHPGHKDLVLRHVLSDFEADDAGWLEPLLAAVAEAAPLLVAADEHAFANKVSVLLAPPAPRPARSLDADA